MFEDSMIKPSSVKNIIKNGLELAKYKYEKPDIVQKIRSISDEIDYRNNSRKG